MNEPPLAATVHWTTEPDIARIELSIRRLQLCTVVLILIVICLLFGSFIATAMIVAAVRQPAADRQAMHPESNSTGTESANPGVAIYTNFARVSTNPEELVVDFGLNRKAVGHVEVDTVPIGQSVVMNYYTAKRFAAALQLSIERHESVFGPIETDIEKRIISESQ